MKAFKYPPVNGKDATQDTPSILYGRLSALGAWVVPPSMAVSIEKSFKYLSLRGREIDGIHNMQYFPHLLDAHGKCWNSNKSVLIFWTFCFLLGVTFLHIFYKSLLYKHWGVDMSLRAGSYTPLGLSLHCVHVSMWLREPKVYESQSVISITSNVLKQHSRSWKMMLLTSVNSWYTHCIAHANTDVRQISPWVKKNPSLYIVWTSRLTPTLLSHSHIQPLFNSWTDSCYIQ